MKVLLVGTGGVGEAIARIAKDQPWVEQVVLTDYNRERLKEVQAKLGDPKRFPIEWIDASKQEMIEKLAAQYKVDLIMNACDPSFNEPIFDAAYNVGCTYMDMAMTLSSPHPRRPLSHRRGVKLGDYQFERAKKWEEEGHSVPGRPGSGTRHGGCICQICRHSISSMRSKKSASGMVPTWRSAAMNLPQISPSGPPSKNA